MIHPDATVQIFFALKTLQCRHVFNNSYFALHQKRNDFIDPSEQSVKKKKKKEKEKRTQILPRVSLIAQNHLTNSVLFVVFRSGLHYISVKRLGQVKHLIS